jgi:hypothetical protein
VTFNSTSAPGWHPEPVDDVALLRGELDACRAEIERLRAGQDDDEIIEVDEEIVLAVLAGGFRSFSSLGYHDKNMMRGRALSRLRDAHRDEYEHHLRVETAKLIASGQERGF